VNIDISRVDKLLSNSFGKKVLRPHNDPVGELVRTMLSQNTSDINRDRAYERLRQRFPRWEDVVNARTNSIRIAIKPGGLSAIKAPRIKSVLRKIQDGHGEIDLSDLKRMPAEKGIAYLTSFNGVGFKTAACVLLFSYGKEVFPVDTHVYRVTQRLGMIPHNCGLSRAHAVMNEIVPVKSRYQLHLNLIELGRKVCRPRAPLCAQCVLNQVCPSAFSFGA